MRKIFMVLFMLITNIAYAGYNCGDGFSATPSPYAFASNCFPKEPCSYFGEYDLLKQFSVVYPDKNNYSTPVKNGIYEGNGFTITASTYYDFASPRIEYILANKNEKEWNEREDHRASRLLKSGKAIEVGLDYMMLMYKFEISGAILVSENTYSFNSFHYDDNDRKKKNMCNKSEKSNSIECIMPYNDGARITIRAGNDIINLMLLSGEKTISICKE